MSLFSSIWYRVQLISTVLIAAGLAGGFPTQAHAQQSTGAVEGLVQTADGTPARGVNVSLQGTSLGTTTTEDGGYVIKNVPADSYTLVVSYVGLETKRRDITVEGNARTTVPAITLEESTKTLAEVVVEGGERTSYTPSSSPYVAKMPLEDIDNPQVYNAIPSTLLDDQVATSFEDVMTNAPGIFKLWEATGRGSDGAGSYSIRGFSVQPTMKNGLPALTNGSPDPSNIERVEIIKGPSSTLYGSSLISYGGLINVATKKPQHSSLNGEVSYKTKSFGLNSMNMNRVTADVNAPVSDDLALRINGSFHDEDSFQDAGFRRSFFLAPSLSYKPTRDLSVLVSSELYTSEQTNPTMLFMNRAVPLEATTVEELGYDPQHSFTDDDVTIRTPTFGVQTQMQYQLSEQWETQTAASFSSASSEGYYSYLWDGRRSEDTFTRFVNDQDQTTTGIDVQQNLLGDFSLFGAENKMVAGLEYFRDRVSNENSEFKPVGQVAVPTSSPAGFSKSDVDAALEDANRNDKTTKQARYSAYASDVVNLIPELSVMASLRLDHFDQEGDTSTEEDDYTQTTLSPKFGVVVQPLPNRLSVFGNYMNGFQNVEPQTQNGQTQTFEPERANQWETGVKANLFEGRLETTASYYDITVSNKVRPDPDNPDASIQDGRVRSRGVELSATAAPVEGLQLIAGYSYNHSENEQTEQNVEGRRPEEAGPEHLVNGWAHYRLSNGPLDGLGLGIGGNYASENVVLNKESTGQFTLSSYVVLDASISYETNRYRVDLKLDNLTDKTYYKGWTTINPQAPRSVTANVTYKF
ncbi:TonB-dependent siderophore receptor [Salinibacter sp.]|uniref:TonB-dependent siderophore receptor n=1 Tax=Salinibacter sp. TaxID=2065818 RepID=UPI0021E7D8D0|nr:TonB-dependent receptor [Salinibacter sp.]